MTSGLVVGAVENEILRFAQDDKRFGGWAVENEVLRFAQDDKRFGGWGGGERGLSLRSG